MSVQKHSKGNAYTTLTVVSCLLFLAYVLLSNTKTEPRCVWHVVHQIPASQKPHGVAASPAVSVVAGLMVTRQVASERINAFHLAVHDFNAAQDLIQVHLRMFVGRESHPMLEQQLAIEASQDDTRDVPTSFPVFVKGQFPENMDNGKTYEWFQFASAAYPSSDWILKFDADVAVNWTAVSPWLHNTASKMRYMGFANGYDYCQKYNHCPPPGCEDMSGGCWNYMSGGFYGLSTPLARIISNCRYYKSHKVGYEDLLVGKAIKHCAASTYDVQFMAVPLMEAWCHSKAVNVTHIRNGMHIAGCSG
jgi:hypothetical protein